MDSKPRWLACGPGTGALSSSSPVSPSSPSSQLYCRGCVLGSDLHSRGPPLKLDSDSQRPRFLDSSRDYGIPEESRSGWALASAQSADSLLCDHSWTRGRSRQGDPERQPGACSGLANMQPDEDPRRSKLSCSSSSLCSRSPHLSAVSSSLSSTSAVSDSSRKSCSPVPRSPPSSSEGSGIRAERSCFGTGAGSHGTRTLESRSSSLSFTQHSERVTSCYAQGARPKETTPSSQLAVPVADLHCLPSEYQPSWLSRSTSRTPVGTLSSPSTGPPEPPGGSSDPQAHVRPPPPRDWSNPAPERPAGPSCRWPFRQLGVVGDAEERRGSRPLLSRLASSVSSTLFSRRPAQDPASADPASGPAETESIVQGERRRSSDDTLQGFPSLRRRRQGVSFGPLNYSTDLEAEPPRPSASWLSSSLRSRCAPLFPRRRREGRDETALALSAGVLDSPQAPPPRTEDTDAGGVEEGDEDEEAQGARAAPCPLAEAPSRPGRDHQLSRVTNSLLCLSLPSPLEGARENAMVTVNITTAGRTLPDRQREEKPAASRDPERLKKIQESLLLEESEEEEGDLCRICQMGENVPSNPLIEPCHCTGSLQYVHQDCMKKWLRAKISSGSSMETVATCELCREKLRLNIDDFDVDELYRMHKRSEYEFISCGLYLVVLLHLCEQRFSEALGIANDVGFFNLARTLQEHMDDLENTYGEESEEEDAQQSRPSVELCDSEDERF